MKSKKTEFMLLGAVIFALVAYLVLRPGDQPADRLPQPAPVDTGQINRLVITAPGTEPLELVKKDTRWTIEPQGYPGNTAQVRNMVKAAADLTLTALVSESGNYERYGLTADEQIIVNAFRDGTPVRSFAIGKAAPTHQHTYVLLDGNPNVYHARGQITWTFDQTVEDLRDRAVFDFDRATVHTIALTRGSETRVLSQRIVTSEETPADTEAEQAFASPALPEWHDARGNAVDTEAATRLLDAMARLDCDGYLDDDASERLTEARWQITFENPDGNYTLMLFDWPEADDTLETVDEKLPAMASTNNYAFVLDAERVKQFETAINVLFDGNG